MVLELGYFEVKEILLGQETRLDGTTLTIDPVSLQSRLLARDDRITGVETATAEPGQSVRIACVKDVIEPRCKVDGDEIGTGRTHVLDNVAVVTCGQIVGFQEGIIDMSGEGALHTPFSRTLNLVLDIGVAAGVTPHEHEEIVRHAGLRAAEFIARSTIEAQPARIETYVPDALLDSPPALPRVVYVYMLLSQGLLHDTYVLGRNAKEGLPCILPPHLLLDGALTSGNCVSACDKNTTYHHQNNPVLRELYRRHGTDLHFAGVVLTNEPVSLAAKQESARTSVELAKTLKAEAAIITKEGFGNPDADQMLLIQGLEKEGIITVALTDEWAGPNGASQSLADSTPEAIAMVSVGNANERILLAPMDRILGPIKEVTKLAGAYPHSLHPDGSLEVELQTLIGSTNELGVQSLRCREV